MPSTISATTALRSGSGRGQPVIALVDRKQPADKKQQHRDHHRPEVHNAVLAERVFFGLRTLRLPHSEQEQKLIGGVGDGVDRFGQHRAGARVRSGAELGDGDSAVRSEREQDGPGAVGCHAQRVARTTTEV